MDAVETAREQWAARIAGAWRKSVEAILEAGRLLIEAKAALPHGAFADMIESDLPFGARMAQMLMAIARNPRLVNAKHVSLLPPHVGTLYELTKLTEDEFEAKLATGQIHPELERRDVVVAEMRARRLRREAELGAFQAALPDRRYGVTYADPPWRFEPYLGETSNALAEDHYPTMSLDQIKALDVASIAADDCAMVFVGDRADAATRARSDGGVGLLVQIRVGVGERPLRDRLLVSWPARALAARYARRAACARAGNAMAFGDRSACPRAQPQARPSLRACRILFPASAEDRTVRAPCAAGMGPLGSGGPGGGGGGVTPRTAAAAPTKRRPL